MKNRSIIYLVLAYLFVSCSKDVGNYDYVDVNVYEVSGIRTGSGVSRNYDVVMGQTLSIQPVIESSLGTDESDLSYKWVVENDTVSEERNLEYLVNLPIALHQAKFVLLDNRTGIEYSVGFAINVTSPFGRGYFFLNEDEVGNSWLSFKAVSDEELAVVNTDNINDVKFGKYPMKMNGVKKYKSGPNDYSWEVYVLSKEGEYSTILANLTSYTPLKFFGKNSYVGTWAQEYEFNPTHVDLRSAGRTYFITDGKIAFFDDNNLYRHSQLYDNTPDYKLDNALIGDINRFSSIRSIIGFDLLSYKFKVISPYSQSDPSKGIIYDVNLLDRALDIESPEGAYDGHRVAGSFSAYISSTGLLNNKILTIKENTVTLSELNVAYASPYVPELTSISSQTINGLKIGAPTTLYEHQSGDAYIAVGNKILKSSIVTLSFGDFLTVNPDLGEITAIKYQINSTNSENPRLFVGTYDPSSTEDLKGSILIYDVNTKTVLHELKNVTNKVVDIFLAE